MRIFFEELKKLWRPRVVVVLALAGVVYFGMACAGYIDKDPIGGDIDTGRMLVAQYGPTLEDEEYADLTQNVIPPLHAALDTQIAADPLAQKHGIADYDSLQQFVEDNAPPTPEGSALLSFEDVENLETSPAYDDGLQILFALNADSITYSRYESLLKVCTAYQAASQDTGKAQGLGGLDSLGDRDGGNAGIIAFNESVLHGPDEAWRGILPFPVDLYTLIYANQALPWLTLSALLLVALPLVGDRLSRMRAVQWSSRAGRRILFIQFGASMLSALIWITLNTAIFAALFLRNNYSVFNGAHMASFLASSQYMVDMRYGQWYVLLFGMCVLLGLGIAALGFFMARYSENYIGMLLRLIPLAVAAYLLATRWFSSTASYFFCNLPQIIVFLVVAVGLCIVTCARQQHAELLAS